MSLEACPVCGYALCTVDFQCRHCAQPAAFPGSKYLDAKLMAAMASGLAILGLLIYLLFRH